MNLNFHEDGRGHLIEIFKDVDGCMAYAVLTHAGVGRDVDVWHLHERKTETFLCLHGRAALAVKFQTGEVKVKELGMNPIMVCPGIKHSLITVGETPSVVYVFCDIPEYDPSDEHRVAMEHFSWSDWGEWWEKK